MKKKIRWEVHIEKKSRVARMNEKSNNWAPRGERGFF
jgi:hypothetical protein